VWKKGKLPLVFQRFATKICGNSALQAGARALISVSIRRSLRERVGGTLEHRLGRDIHGALGELTQDVLACAKMQFMCGRICLCVQKYRFWMVLHREKLESHS
jgi:hypothetical protein